MFIGSEARSEPKPECISPQIARQWARAFDVGRQQAGLGLDFVEVFGNRQRVPDLDAVVLQRGHQHGLLDSSSISAFMDGSSGGITFSVKSRPASLAVSQPRKAQAP